MEITLRDVYFWTSLHVLGLISETMPKIPSGVSMHDLYDKNFYSWSYVHKSYILVCDIESLVTQAMASMVL